MRDVCFEGYFFWLFFERQCQGFFMCKYGVCVEEVGEFLICVRYLCGCDQWVSGQQCEYWCCCDCGEYGECVFSNGQEFCSCQYGFVGKICNEMILESKLFFMLLYISFKCIYSLIVKCLGILNIFIYICVFDFQVMWRSRCLGVLVIGMFGCWGCVF